MLYANFPPNSIDTVARDVSFAQIIC